MTLKELIKKCERISSLLCINIIIDHADGHNKYIMIRTRNGGMHFHYSAEKYPADPKQVGEGVRISCRQLEAFLKKLKKVEDLDSEDWVLWNPSTLCYMRNEVNSILDTLLTSNVCRE